MIERVEDQLVCIITHQNSIEVKHHNIEQLHLVLIEPIVVECIGSEVNEHLHGIILVVYRCRNEHESILKVVECCCFGYRNDECAQLLNIIY